MAAVRKGDTLVVPKLDRLARSVPDARHIADQLEAKGVKLALGRNIHDPSDPMGKMFFNILATFAEFEADLIRMRTREGMAIARAKEVAGANSPSSPKSSNGNFAACTPPATIPSAIWRKSSPYRDRPSTGRSTARLLPHRSTCLGVPCSAKRIVPFSVESHSFRVVGDASFNAPLNETERHVKVEGHGRLRS